MAGNFRDFRYFRPLDGVLDSKGPLSSAIAPRILAEVNKQVKSVTGASTPVSVEFEPLSDDSAVNSVKRKHKSQSNTFP